MFERLSNSYALARSSWQVLRQDKQLIVFPIMSGIGCLLVMAGFAVPLVVWPQLLDFLGKQAQGNQPSPWLYVLAFAYYFCSYFVVIFFNAALISCAIIRFNGAEPTVGDGLRAAWLRLPQILAWAALSATVGVLLKAIESVHDKLGQLISWLLGTAWAVITYFVVPVLVVEKVGPFQAIKRSLQILKKTWGEAVIGRLGLGLFMFLLALPGIALIVLGALLMVAMPIAIGVAVIVLGLLYFVLLAAVGSALQGIFLSALYQYAAFGQVPSGFDQDVMKHAFEPKKKRGLFS